MYNINRCTFIMQIKSKMLVKQDKLRESFSILVFVILFITVVLILHISQTTLSTQWLFVGINFLVE